MPRYQGPSVRDATEEDESQRELSSSPEPQTAGAGGNYREEQLEEDSEDSAAAGGAAQGRNGIQWRPLYTPKLTGEAKRTYDALIASGYPLLELLELGGEDEDEDALDDFVARVQRHRLKRVAAGRPSTGWSTVGLRNLFNQLHQQRAPKAAKRKAPTTNERLLPRSATKDQLFPSPVPPPRHPHSSPALLTNSPTPWPSPPTHRPRPSPSARRRPVASTPPRPLPGIPPRYPSWAERDPDCSRPQYITNMIEWVYPRRVDYLPPEIPDTPEWNAEIDAAIRQFLKGYIRLVLSFAEKNWRAHSIARKTMPDFPCQHEEHESGHRDMLEKIFVGRAMEVMKRTEHGMLPSAAERVILTTAVARGNIKTERGWDTVVEAEDVEGEIEAEMRRMGYDPPGLIRDLTRERLGRIAFSIMYVVCPARKEFGWKTMTELEANEKVVRSCEGLSRAMARYVGRIWGYDDY